MNDVHTALLSVAIVEEMELMWVCCEWRIDLFLLNVKLILSCVNRLKPSGHVMHHQFNIQQLYALPTLYLCVLYLSENKQRLVPFTAWTDWFL
jgi:hypothetical protein